MLLVGCAVSLLGACAQSVESSAKAPVAKVRMGTYDSRSVAIAFAGSAPFNKWMGDLKAEHEKAKRQGIGSALPSLRLRVQPGSGSCTRRDSARPR